MNVEDLKTALADYEDLLTFEDVGEYITIKLNQFLHGEHGKAKWSAINDQIKQFGGTWVSAGKQSRWQIKRETPHAPVVADRETDVDVLVRDIIELLEKALTKLREAGY